MEDKKEYSDREKTNKSIPNSPYMYLWVIDQDLDHALVPIKRREMKGRGFVAIPDIGTTPGDAGVKPLTPRGSDGRGKMVRKCGKSGAPTFPR